VTPVKILLNCEIIFQRKRKTRREPGFVVTQWAGLHIREINIEFEFFNKKPNGGILESRESR
jgi:hypothetical protein